MNRAARFFILIGCLLIACALGLTACNLIDEARAEKKAGEALSLLAEALGNFNTVSTSAPITTDDNPILISPPSVNQTDQSEADTFPSNQPDPNMEMPVIQLDGQLYAGILSIPSLSLELPVLRNWSQASLKNAPCCYAGSLYQKNLVIAGHNYKGHFGKLSDLQIGDSIFFTDATGHCFVYEAVEFESLPAGAVEDMIIGNWDLTLFTCTVGGRSRLTVRCVLTES